MPQDELDGEDQLLDAIKELIPSAVPGAKAMYAVVRMNRIVSVRLRDGSEYRITVEQVEG